MNFMKPIFFTFFNKFCVVFLLVFCLQNCFSQNDSIVKSKSAFWQKVSFGGGLGLGFGNGFTNLSLSPTGYYNINEKYMVGVGLTGSYISQSGGSNNFNAIGYKSTILGGSVIGIANLIDFVQLSAELEQLNVNTKFDSSTIKSDNFWNTALFLGAGYRNENFTFGMRYNVLYKESNNVYSQAWMPFLRVIF
jgi:hypothetical protein